MLRAFPAGDQRRSKEICQIHQIKYDQSRKPVAIALIQGTGDKCRIDRASFSEWDMLCTPPVKGESTTLSVTVLLPQVRR